MTRIVRAIVVALVGALAFVHGLHLQGGDAVLFGQEKPRISTDRPELSWAFPLKVDREFPENPAPQTLPGSTKKYTEAEIDDLMNPPDWYPDAHPAPPSIVVKGRGDAMACGACHLMSGLGHPESNDLTGLSVDYFMQQMADFRSGARIDIPRMNGIAKATTDEEARQAAEYFAKLPRKPFTRVIEADTVPKTFLGNGRMRFAEPGGATEPIGTRIISLPEDQALARRRDPNSGFIAYVPTGSIAKGKLLADGGGGKTVACGFCHGFDLKGMGKVPRLAGVHPIYLARQLYRFKDGTRNGPDAALMSAAVIQLTDDDIVSLSAFLGSVAP